MSATVQINGEHIAAHHHDAIAEARETAPSVDMLVIEVVTFAGYTADDVARAIHMLPGVAMTNRLDV